MIDKHASWVAKLSSRCVFAVVLILIVVASCQPRKGGTEENEDSGSAQIRAGGVPGMLTGSCLAPSADEGPVPICEWIGSADAVFWGTLVDVRFERELAVRTTQPSADGTTQEWEFVRCEAAVAPAVVLDLAVDTVLAGEVPERVEVRIGYNRIQQYAFYPSEFPPGNVSWISRYAEGHAVGQGLEVGQTVGVAAYYLEGYSTWSILGERLFAFRASDSPGEFSVEVQQNLCARPLEVVGMESSDLLTRARECAVTGAPKEALERRSIMFRSWGPDGPRGDGMGDPRNFIAGSCAPAPAAPPGTQCTPETVEEHCEQSAVCLDGRCHALR